jgi:hypothetical protein
MDYCESNKKLKASTLETKHNMIEKHILPYFGDMLTANITKVDVLSWQRTWDIYGHLYPNSQQEAVAKMDGCIKI